MKDKYFGEWVEDRVKDIIKATETACIEAVGEYERVEDVLSGEVLPDRRREKLIDDAVNVFRKYPRDLADIMLEERLSLFGCKIEAALLEIKGMAYRCGLSVGEKHEDYKTEFEAYSKITRTVLKEVDTMMELKAKAFHQETDRIWTLYKKESFGMEDESK